MSLEKCTVPLTAFQVQKVMQGMEHRPFNPESDAHQRFLRRQLQKLQTLRGKYPGLVLDAEQAFFESQLIEPVVTQGR